MRHKRLFYILAGGLLMGLVACSPAGGTEPPLEDSNPPVEQDEPAETAVAPDSEEIMPDTDAETQPADDAQAPPDPTPDRSMRLTPQPLPRGAEPIPQQTTTAPLTEPITEPVPDEMMTQVLADLQTRIGRSALSPDDYQIVKSEAVIWSDGALGCPEPGMMYTQALVEGYHLIIQANDQTWDYRLSNTGLVKLCEQTLRP